MGGFVWARLRLKVVQATPGLGSDILHGARGEGRRDVLRAERAHAGRPLRLVRPAPAMGAHVGAATFGVDLLRAVVAVLIANVPPLNALLLACRVARRVFLKSFAASRPGTIGR